MYMTLAVALCHISLATGSGGDCRWHGKEIPIVKFLNGREVVVTPEKFTTDVPGHGMCKRMQVSLRDLFSCWLKGTEESFNGRSQFGQGRVGGSPKCG